METVNDFKKLLDVDLGQFRINSTDFRNLDSINRQSEKLNKLLENNVLHQQVGSTAECNDHLKQTCDNPSSSNNVPNDIVNANPTEQMHDFKRRKNTQTFPVYELSKENHIQKRPFLKKGEGLRRFGVDKKVEFDNVPAQAKISALVPNHLVEKLCSKSLNLSPPGEEQTQVNEAKCKSRKILPLVTKQTARIPKIPQTRTTSSNNLEKLEPLFSTMSIRKPAERKCENNAPANIAIDNKDLYSTSSESKEQPLYGHSILVVKRIGQLEKKLLDLMRLKTTLSQEVTEKDENKNENLISSQLVDILSEISKLNDKLAPLSECGPDFDFEAKGHSDNHFNKDTKSRDFGAPKNNSESTQISVLSNGDKIKLSKDHSLSYEHSNGISQTIYRDGLKVVHFPNGQIERIHSNGTRQIIYSNGQQRIIKADNSEQLYLDDGRVCTFFTDGTEKIEYLNGDIELKTAQYTKRYFNNGDIKTVYANGCHETIYCNGRIRMKDALGNVVFDQTP